MSLKDCIKQFKKELSPQDRAFLETELEAGKTDRQALNNLAAVINQEMEALAKRVTDAGGTVLRDSPAEEFFAQSLENQLLENQKWSKWRPSKTSTGKILGAPQWVNRTEKPGSAVGALERKLTARIQEGLVGRFWYEDSAKAVMNIVNNDLQEAERFIQLIAIYSPQANVQVNTSFAVKAWNQYKRNDPINVKTGDQDSKASAVLYGDLAFDGRKTNSFYQNLMYELVKQHPKARDVLSLDAETVEGLDKPATIDMWMFRAFEFDNEAAADDKGSGAYSFAENMIRRITAKLNQKLEAGQERWTPHQVQAAIWTAMKARYETDWVKQKTNRESLRKGYSFIPKTGKNKGKLVRKSDKASERAHRKIWGKWARKVTPEEATHNADITAASFETFIDQMTETVTWETMPSTKLNLAINNADDNVKAQFHRDALQLVVDENGTDQLAALLGIPLNYVRLSRGGYEGQVNENYLTHLVPEKGQDGFDTDAVRSYARAMQYIFKQDAVPWFRADPRALLSQQAKSDQMFRVIRPTGKTARKFDTLEEAQKFATEKGEGFTVRGGKYQRSTGITFKEKLSHEQLESVLKSLHQVLGSDAGFTVVGPTEIAVVNYRDDDTGIPDVSDEYFDAQLLKIEDELQDLGAVDFVDFWSEGEYGHYQDWTTDPEGSQVLEARGLAGRSDLQAWIRGRREAFDALLEEYSAGNLKDRAVDTRQIEYLAQSAYHATGEGRTYDKFSTDYVGSGKGVGQFNFGWGLYFTDTAAIANRYYEMLREERGEEGALYAVTLLPAEDEYLLWDMGVERQPQHIQDALVQLTERPIEYFQGIGFTGGDVYNMLSRKFGSDKEASLDLLGAGIKGVKYRDASNQEWGYQSYNYVIFDDAHVEMVDRLLQTGVFYSALERGAKQLQKKGRGDQLLAQLKKMPGVKAEELEWLGIEDYLAGKESITRDEVVQFIRDGGVKVEEVTYGLDPRGMIEDIRIDMAQTTADASAVLAREDLLGFENVNEALHAIKTHENWQSLWEVVDQNNLDTLSRWRAKQLEFDERRARAKPTKYQQYTTPGGTDYREMVLTLPVQVPTNPREHLGGAPNALTPNEAAQVLGMMEGDFPENTKQVLVYYPSRYYIEQLADDTYHVIVGRDEFLGPSLEEAEAFLVNQLGSELDEETTEEFRTGHWEEPNVLGHVRFNAREIEGKNTLFIEEIQSDWHQAGRREGYRDPRAKARYQKQVDELDEKLKAIYEPHLPADMPPPVEWVEAEPVQAVNIHSGYIEGNESEIGDVAGYFNDRLEQLGIDPADVDYSLEDDPDTPFIFQGLPDDVYDELEEISEQVGARIVIEDSTPAADAPAQRTWTAEHPSLALYIVERGPNDFIGFVGQDETIGSTLEAVQATLNTQVAANHEQMGSDVGIWHQLREQKGPLWEAIPEDQKAELATLVEDRDEAFAKTVTADRAGQPNAPFKKTWPLLMMKRMIRYAVDNNFDQVAWTTGDQQANRYGDREGMIGFYDQMVPSMTKKYIKKMGADVGMVELTPAVITAAPRPAIPPAPAPGFEAMETERENNVNIAIDNLLNAAAEGIPTEAALETATEQITEALGDIGLSEEFMADVWSESVQRHGQTTAVTDARDRQLEDIRDEIYESFEEPIALNRLDRMEAEDEAEVAARAERPADRPYFDVPEQDRQRWEHFATEEGETVIWDLAYSRPAFDDVDLDVVHKEADEFTEPGWYVVMREAPEEEITGPYDNEEEAELHLQNRLDPLAATEFERFDVIIPVTRVNEEGVLEVQSNAMMYYQGRFEDSYQVAGFIPWTQSSWTELQEEAPPAPAPAPTPTPWQDFTIDTLTARYQSWTEEEGLPAISADELDTDMLTDDQLSQVTDFVQIWEAVQSEEDNSQIGVDLMDAIVAERGADNFFHWSEAMWLEGAEPNMYIYHVPVETDIEGVWMKGTLEVNVELDPDRDPPIESPDAESFNIEEIFVGDWQPFANLMEDPAIPVPVGEAPAPVGVTPELIGPTEGRVQRPAVMVHGFPVTEKMRETAMQGQALFQDVNKEEERARYYPNVGEERIIQLTEASDLSSFLHESGHLFLDIQKVWARKYGLNENQQGMLKWLGVRRFEDLGVEHHEKWAETFEVYLREGKAPSLSLRRAFASFSRWLKRIYAMLSDPRLKRAKLNPEITEIFDRMLATQDEIDEAAVNPEHQTMFRSQEEAGMTDTEWKEYQARANRVRETAEMTLDEKVIKEYKAQKSAEWKAEKKPLIEKHKETLADQPEYQVISSLVGDQRMDWHKLKDEVGEIPRGKFIGKAVGGGVDPAIYAEQYGYSSVKDMYDKINNKPTLKQAAENAAEAEMLAKHGDILNDGSLEEEVREAMVNEDAAAMIYMELKAARKKEGWLGDVATPQQKINRKYLRTEAEALIGTMTYKQIKPDKYYRQMVKAAQRAARGEDVTQSKIQQLANHYLYKTAMKTREKMLKDRKTIQAVAKRKYSPTDVPSDYITQMKELALMYDLRSKPEARVRYANNMLDWYAAQLDTRNNLEAEINNLELLDPNLVDALEYRMKNNGSLEGFELKTFNEMTAEEIRGVVEMLQHLRYVGGQIATKGKDEVVAAREAGGEAVLENGGKDFWVNPNKPRPFDQPKLAWSSMTSALPSLGNMVRKLDGFKEDGWAYRNILLPINQAVSAKWMEQERLHDTLDQYMGNISSVGLSNRDGKEFTKEDGTTESFSSEEVFMMAVYWGTESSRRAITEGHGMTEQDVAKLMERLSKDQLQLVNAIWAMNEKQWPGVRDAAVDLNGVAPPKLKPTPFMVNGIQMTGGHMQLMYTGIKIELQDEQVRGMNTSSVVPTRAGSTYQRIGSGGQQVRLQISNIVQSAEEKAHYVAFARAGRDLRALVNDKSPVAEAIIQKHGEKFYKNFIHAIQGVTAARPAIETNDGLAWLSSMMRGNATMMHLAFSVRNVTQQWGAAPIAMKEVGTIRFAQASGILAKRPKETMDMINTKSKFMKNRAQVVNREAREYLRKVVATNKGRKLWEGLKARGFIMQTAVDMTVAYPTWYAKYNHGMERHGDEKRAILDADTAVAESVGSGADLHLGRIMQSNQNEFVKTLTVFGSWFNAYYQRLYRSSKGGTNYLNPQFLADGVILPIIVANLTQMLISDWPDEDEEWWEYARKNTLLFLAGTLPLVRDVGSLTHGFTPSSPLGNGLSAAYRLPQEWGAYNEGRQSGIKFLSDAGRASSQLIRIPGSGNVWRMLDYVDSYLQGEEGDDFSIWQGLTEGADRDR